MVVATTAGWRHPPLGHQDCQRFPGLLSSRVAPGISEPFVVSSCQLLAEERPRAPIDHHIAPMPKGKASRTKHTFDPDWRKSDHLQPIPGQLRNSRCIATC